MASEADSYRVCSKHYDAAYAAKQDLEDAPFYVDLAKRAGGPLLEIGCGTGRILLSIAREGIEIDGVDNSSPMLDILRKHLEDEPPDVRGKVTLHEGDMRSFRLPKKYALVIMPFRPMQHMYTVTDQADALATAAFHLQASGKLAFDVFFPKLDAIPKGVGEETLDLEWPLDTQPARVVRRYFRKDSFHLIQQNFSGTFLFRTYEGDKLVGEETEPLKMSYYTYPQLRALFLLAGLEPLEEYGSFKKTPLDNAAREMIFVLRKTRGGAA
jgi:ubiquinone/menaquinone biosynthesis C-methylase UbiE